MKALQFLQSERRLEVREVSWPVIISPREVIVRVAFAGVCGTDLHALSGEFAMSQSWHTMGHEFSGVVAEVGEGVTTVSVGDRVAVDPNRGCGVCRDCKLGNIHFCPTEGPSNGIGFWRHGGWAEAVLADEGSVHQLPDCVPLQTAALCEPLSCLLHGHDLFSPIPPHGRVVVLGAGIIGLLTACLLHHRGVTDVTVSEPSAARRRFLEELRLGYRALSPAELAAEFQDMSEEQVSADGLDMVIDCSGFCPAIEQAAGFLRRGGALCLFGMAPSQGRVSLSPYLLVTRELSVRGAIINPHTFPRATRLAAALGQRYLALSQLGVELFKLDQHQQAMAKLKNGDISKAMFVVDDTLE